MVKKEVLKEVWNWLWAIIIIVGYAIAMKFLIVDPIMRENSENSEINKLERIIEVQNEQLYKCGMQLRECECE